MTILAGFSSVSLASALLVAAAAFSLSGCAPAPSAFDAPATAEDVLPAELEVAAEAQQLTQVDSRLVGSTGAAEFYGIRAGSKSCLGVIAGLHTSLACASSGSPIGVTVEGLGEAEYWEFGRVAKPEGGTWVGEFLWLDGSWRAEQTPSS